LNISLKNRIAASFIFVTLMVLALGFSVFYFLHKLNTEISQITTDSNNVSVLTDQVRISAVSILKSQRRIISNRAKSDDLDELISLCDDFQAQLQKLETYYSEAEIKKTIGKMTSYTDALKTLVSKVQLSRRDSAGLSTIGDLADKILEAFSEFQNIQYYQSEERDKRINKIIEETKKHMLIALIITFFFSILMSLVIPGKIALPFKKINDAIRELQECNFDVSIYYNQDDEIGELAREINKMIHSMKTFDELRANRIQMEHRKFDALASLVKKLVIISNAKGDLIYMNNQMYSMLDLQSDDIINKNYADTLIPDCIKETYDLAIKRRSKIENADIEVFKRHLEDESEEGQEHKEPELTFKGFATVIPIRGKDNSSDFYLMVLSDEALS
jgi:nitrogen fixation/metabolism regulation signal transduction histidine kinase